MSLFRLTIAKSCTSLSKILSASTVNPLKTGYSSAALFSTSSQRYCQEAETTENSHKNKKKNDPLRDRSTVIPVETSIKYLASDAYKQTYGGKLVWENYRRNHKGGLPPRRTRRSCLRQNYVQSGNPCPICRDEYLVLHHDNLELLKQFISPHTGEVLSYEKTGLCQKKQLKLLVVIERAVDRGLIELPVPFRWYDYSEYYNYKEK